MSQIPSIKGSVFQIVHEAVRKMLAVGELSRAEAARWLQKSDFDHLDKDVSIASWYDIASYDRLCRLLQAVEGGGRTEYLVEEGRTTARRLRESGLYDQMEYLDRAQALQTDTQAERFEALKRDLRRMNTLSASLFNFTKWDVDIDPATPSRYRILVRESAALPETLLWRIQGFMNETAKRHIGDGLWSWRRERDLVVFSMSRDI